MFNHHLPNHLELKMFFLLPTGKITEKDATYCVATKTRDRWHHRFFKSYKGADNEYSSQRAHLRNPDMIACYGLQETKLIKGTPNNNGESNG